MSKQIPVTFTTAIVVEPDWFYFAASPDKDEPYSPFTRFFQYTEGEKYEWTYHDVNW